MIVFDGDALVYIAGFAADSRNGPFSHSAHNVKLIINKVLKATRQKKFKIFLTSKRPEVNFRTEISPIYKKNRTKTCKKCKGQKVSQESYVARINKSDGTITRRRCYTCLQCQEPVADSKPVYYNRIRRYLIDRCGAKVCTWGEADDYFGACGADWIATHDKDIYQLGKMKFYNLKSDEILKTKTELGKIHLKKTQICSREGEPQFNKDGTPKLRKDIKGHGFKWFCVQMISGDKVDNILKVKSGDGPVWIEKIFGPLKTMRECWNMVKLYYHGTNSDDKLWLNAQLLWVARKPMQRCSEEVIEEMIQNDENPTT